MKTRKPQNSGMVRMCYFRYTSSTLLCYLSYRQNSFTAWWSYHSCFLGTKI